MHRCATTRLSAAAALAASLLLVVAQPAAAAPQKAHATPTASGKSATHAHVGSAAYRRDLAATSAPSTPTAPSSAAVTAVRARSTVTARTVSFSPVSSGARAGIAPSAAAGQHAAGPASAVQRTRPAPPAVGALVVPPQGVLSALPAPAPGGAQDAWAVIAVAEALAIGALLAALRRRRRNDEGRAH